MRKRISGQSVVEYFIILVVVLAALLSTGFIDRMRGAFETYFNKAVVHFQ